jgi:hypothetical protein
MNWITTVEPAPWSIAGYELGPLLFGHCMLIERFEIDQINDEQALHFFLNVCSRTYVDARQWITSANTDTVTRFKDFQSHRQEVFEYLKENMGLPPTLNSNSGGKTLGTPYLQGLRLKAITKLNYNPETICDARFGQLVWDTLSYSELNGQTRVIDDFLAKQLERLENANAKV